MEEFGEYEIRIDENRNLRDFLSPTTSRKATSEEIVRQKLLRILHYEYGYPINTMATEIGIRSGSKILKDENGKDIRADVIVYQDVEACASRNQGKIHLVCECKKPDELSGYNQLVSYIFNTSASGGLWYNGSPGAIQYFRRKDRPLALEKWLNIPCHGESWASLDSKIEIELLSPHPNITNLLNRCHNYIHKYGTDTEEEDLTMDMVRLLISKSIDESSDRKYPKFWCSSEEFANPDLHESVKARICDLFNQAKKSHRDIFSESETITIGATTLCRVVTELQRWRIVARASDTEHWDVMGKTYEQYTATYLKRQKGQFFTNRLVIDMMIQMLSPTADDIFLDPAGGAGGFLTSVWRYVRRVVTESRGEDHASRVMRNFANNLFSIDISEKLNRVAKCAMVLNGDGHTGITRGNSLLAYESINHIIATKCGREKPTIIATNPPFAGVGDGRIEAEYILSQYDSGHRWKVQNGEYIKTDKILSIGCPPEMLFLERCIDWLVPGGRLAIVMPKSVLDTDTNHPIRSILFDRCVLNAVMTMDKNTFQPHTGVRTCVLLLTKKTDDWKHKNYPIFMAISRSCGQDSEGVPKYTLDDNNEPTSTIDEDISEIIQKYSEFNSRNFLEEEYTFQVYFDDLEGKLLINPQRYRHSLNASIIEVGEISQNEGWYQTTIGEIEGIELFKGPRLKSENIQVDDYVNDSVEPFYTPSAILQNKSESAKLFDMSRANQKQLKMIQTMRIFRGDVVVTRSGSIGRVKYITSRFDGAIGSDDLIRVRIEDENMQFYLFMFLQHQFGKDQMIRNEYGAVQQHLEPAHIAAIKIPMPNDISKLSEIIDSTREQILTLERYDELVITSQKNLENLFAGMT